MSRAAGAVGMVFAEEIAKGRFSTTGVSREVEKVYRAIERDYPQLRCAWDNEEKEHIIVEHTRDGQHSLVLSRPGRKGFNEDVIRMLLHRADSTKFDPFDEIMRAERDAEAAHDARMHELIGDAGEKLAHAFAQDGLTVRPRMTAQSVRMKRRRALRNFEAPTRTIKNR